MPRSSAEALRMASRRSKVAALVLQGVTNQFEIANKIGLGDEGQSTVSRDLKAIKAEWRQSTLVDWNEAKGKELARLDRVEAEYWAAWERSKIEKESTRTKRRTGGESPSDEAEVKKEKRDGDPRFLEGILGCIAQRCRLLYLERDQDAIEKLLAALPGELAGQLRSALARQLARSQGISSTGSGENGAGGVPGPSAN
jgi:hypothetical protein